MDNSDKEEETSNILTRGLVDVDNSDEEEENQSRRTKNCAGTTNHWYYCTLFYIRNRGSDFKDFFYY